MTELTSTRNPLVHQARLLARDRKERAASGLAVLEGVRLAEEALIAGVDLEYILYSDQLTERERGAAVLAGLLQRGVRLYRCTPDVLAKAADTQTPQGIIGIFRPRRWELADLGAGPVLVLDQVQDPGNLGTALRSAEALGGGGIVLAGGVDSHNPKVVRAAMGSLFRLPVVRGELAEALTALKAAGRRLYVADAAGDLTPWTANLAEPVAIVIGNEGAGPSQAARRLVDGIVTIPMAGPAESLNAGVAASLLLYECLRQRG